MLIFLIISYLIKDPELKDKNNNNLNQKNIITENYKLLNSTGQLVYEGYSKKYIPEFEYESLYPVLFGFTPLKNLRYKKADILILNLDNHYLKLIILDAGYLSVIQILLFNTNNNKVLINKQYKLFLKELGLKDNENNLNYSFNIEDLNEKYIIKYSKKTDNNNSNHEISFHFREYDLKANLKFEKLNSEESIIINQKISEDSKYFVSIIRDSNLECTGEVLYNKEIINNNKCLASKSILRLVLEYKTKFIELLFNDKLGKNKIFFNSITGIGHHESKAVTDYIMIDGKVIELESLQYKYDPLNYYNGFKIYNNNKTVELNFRTTAVNNLKENYILFMIDNTSIFGSFEGYIIDNNHNKYDINIKGEITILSTKF